MEENKFEINNDYKIRTFIFYNTATQYQFIKQKSIHDDNYEGNSQV